MRAHQIPLHWLAVSQVNPDIIMTKINKRWVPFFKHSCSSSHKTKVGRWRFSGRRQSLHSTAVQQLLVAKLQSGLGLPWTAIHHLGKLPLGLPSILLPPGLDCHPPPWQATPWTAIGAWESSGEEVSSTIDFDLQNAHSKLTTTPKSHNTSH